MEKHNLIAIIIVSFLLIIMYYVNSTYTGKKEHFQSNECSDINDDYCKAFNPMSAECGLKHPSKISRDCPVTCDLCDIDPSIRNQINNQNKSTSNQTVSTNSPMQVNRNGNGINNITGDQILSENLPMQVNRNGNGINNITGDQILSENLPMQINQNGNGINNITGDQILSENLPMQINQNGNGINNITGDQIISENLPMQINQNGNGINDITGNSIRTNEESIPSPYNNNIYNIYQEDMTEEHNENLIDSITYKYDGGQFMGNELLYNQFVNANLKSQIVRFLNIEDNLIKDIQIEKGSVLVTIIFTRPVNMDPPYFLSLTVNNMSFKGTRLNDNQLNMNDIVGHEEGYHAVNNTILNYSNHVNNLLNMLNNNYQDKVMNYLNNLTMDDLASILKELLSLNINGNGISDLIDIVNNLLGSNNNVNNWNNNDWNTNETIKNNQNNRKNSHITQKYIKGVGNVFAPRIVISDNDNI